MMIFVKINYFLTENDLLFHNYIYTEINCINFNINFSFFIVRGYYAFPKQKMFIFNM